MSKNTQTNKTEIGDIPLCKSTFTITFAIEVVGVDVWHDCHEGWLDLGSCSQGIKIQYHLYPGKTFDVDILIWPHAAKIWASAYHGWVRTWQFLERRFLAFSIRHAFPVRVAELRNFIATVTPTVGLSCLSANAKNDRNMEVYLPPLTFGEQRYFAPIIDGKETLVQFMENLIWELAAEYIPKSYLDEVFDVPQPVTDARHQNSIIFHVREAILNHNKTTEEVEQDDLEIPKIEDRRESKLIKNKDKDRDKKKAPEKNYVKFEIKLHGDSMLAGIGRIVPFTKQGERPNDLGEIIAIINSTNLPAQDDLPIIFVNVDTLTDIPVDVFKKLRISHIYTRWIIGEEVHNSELEILRSIKNEVKFNDHHAFPLEKPLISKVKAEFLDAPFEIQLRGIRVPLKSKDIPKFFGCQKGDKDFGTCRPQVFSDEPTDILIAVTKIDGRAIANGVNHLLKGDYPLFPPTASITKLERESTCTNDINGIKASVYPDLLVPSYLILEAQMNLEVSIGFVSCKTKKISDCFSRLFCLIEDTDCLVKILKMIEELNEECLLSHQQDEVLTGFALDVGNLVIVYVEGPRDGVILRVWEMNEDFYSKVKPLFSTSDRYSSRIYPELLHTAMPFYILKMYAPLGVLLACPPIYARPALPLPTKSALLKLGRLIGGQLRTVPNRCAMPTSSELESFRLELCVSSKPISPSHSDKNVK